MQTQPTVLPVNDNVARSMLWIVPPVVLLIGLGLTFLACRNSVEEQQAHLQRALDEQAMQSVVRIEKRLQSYQQILEDTAGLVMLKPDLDEIGFKAQIDRLELDDRFPGTLGITLTYAISPKNLDRFVARQQKTRPWFQLHAVTRQDICALVTFIEPLTPTNQKALGLDSLVDPVRAEALVRARDQGKIAVSGPLVLVQDEGEQETPSVLIAAPFYRFGVKVKTEEKRRQHLQGWAVAPLRIADFLKGVLGDDVLTDSMRLSLRVFDVDESGRSEMLFGNSKPAKASALQRVVDIPLGGRLWRIEFATLPGFEQKTGFHWPYAIAFLGSAGSLLLAAVLWLIIHGSNNVRRLARNMTRELRESKELLQAVIEGSNDAIFVKDAEGNFRLANSTLRGWLGPDRNADCIELADKSLVTPEVLSQLRKEDSQIMRDQQMVVSERQISSHDGQLRTLHVTKGPLRAADGTVTGVFGIARDITSQKKAQDQIWHQANYDALTNLPNRRMFRDRLQGEIRRASRNSSMLAVLFIDLDHFKDVNDSQGHDQGDLLLIEVARRILGCVRESDIVARMGGDEFVVILPDITEAGQAARIAHNLLGTLGRSFSLEQGLVYVTASVGIAIYPDDAKDDIALIQSADQAMYASKALGRNSFSFFTQAMQSQAQQRMRLATDLRQAIGSTQLELYFQPVVGSGCQRILKAEALLRWRHPEMGYISPTSFIPIAEESGLIIDIGDWVFRQAVDFLRRWHDRIKAGGVVTERLPQVSVNMSPTQFLGSTDVRAWCDYLKSNDIPPGSVILEITEGLLLERNPRVQEKLTLMREGGMVLALDDFGTGYSAMSYLKKFAVDYLKIDQSFVRDMESDTNDQAIAEAIILMAHKLGISVIAEGVESEGQSQMLTSSNCNFQQGYLFGYPVPEAEFIERFADPG